MNRNFIEQIYEGLYDDPEGEFGKDNPEFGQVVHKAYEAIDIAEKLAKGYGDDMYRALQNVLDALAEQKSMSIRQAYLRGAEDREKMLE
jgi:hypothetical protein